MLKLQQLKDKYTPFSQVGICLETSIHLVMVEIAFE